MSRYTETEQEKKICVSRNIKRGAVEGDLKEKPPLALHTSPTDKRAGSSVKRSKSDQDNNFKVWSLLESFYPATEKLFGIPWFF